MPSLRILATVTAGLGLLTLGVALLVAPPHSVAEATPPPDSDIPLSLICRSGGSMKMELGPIHSYLHYKIRAGNRPKSLKDIQPGECASGNVDIPLGSATIGSLRILETATGCSDNAGFSYSVSATGVTRFVGVAQGCAGDDPACAPSEADRDKASEYANLATWFQSEGKLIEVQVNRDLDRLMAPSTTMCRSSTVVSIPKDI